MAKSRAQAERPQPESLGLPLYGVDSHAHLDGSQFIDSLDEVIARATKAGVSAIGQVFLSPEEYLEGKGRFAAYSHVFFILGIHPCDALKWTDDTLAAMRMAFHNDPRLRAVGETGLDFYWKDCPHRVQEEVFRLQIALARELKRPLVIHSRDAAADTLRILEAEGCSGYPLLWHCFGGDAIQYLDRIVSHGWHISIPGPVSYPSNQELRDALKLIPEDRLLLETDCPYLAPMPWRGKRNEPALSVFTAEAMATALQTDLPTLWKRCGDNAKCFFSWGE